MDSSFHAKDLFHGSKVFDPQHYPPERRRELLRKIVEIPSKFRLAGPEEIANFICRKKLLARSLRRVMVGNQPPAPLLLYPNPGKASVAGNSLAFVLPNHC